MKFLIVLCAAMACASAKPTDLSYALGYDNPLGVHIYPSPSVGYSAYSSYPAYPFAPFSYAAPAPISYAAPAPVTYTRSAPITYTAPATVAYSAPAPIAYAAPAPIAAAATVAAIGTKSQYHAQNELGQASYGHSEPTQTHNAVQDAFGNKVGSFAYTSPDGRVLRTDYVADALGYRVASNALPVAQAQPVADTPEVVAARAQHFAAVASDHHRSRRSVLVQTPASTAPLVHQVAYTAPIAYTSQVAYTAPVAAAPVAYTAPVAAAPIAYTAPVAYTSHVAAAPVAYTTHVAAAPVTTYTAPVAVSREATLTKVVNNPGHAVSYRVD